MTIVELIGFEDCIAGVCDRGGSRFLVYDREKMLQRLCEDMSYEQAVEYFDFNIESAWIGDSTPGFIEEFDRQYERELEDLVE